MAGLQSVLGVVSPSGSDWVVTLLLRDGRVFNRRICPGVGTDEQALSLALRIQGVGPSEVADAVVRRASESRQIETERTDDEWQRLVRGMRANDGNLR